MRHAKHRLIMLCCVISVFFCTSLQARELVIAFENTLQPSSSLDAKARSQMLVRNLANAQVPQAMFLINTYGISAKDHARLGIYSDGGHLLVNAGHGQSLLRRPDLYAFEIGILKANKILARYAGYKKHVHFAYLHEFGDKTLQKGLIDFLRERNYRPAFTGFNAWRGADAYIDQLYQAKIVNNRRVDIVQLEKAYVDLVITALAKQDALAFNQLGYSPIQVLVLQENDLAAYFIAAVVERLHEDGWTLLAAERAFSDPVANPIGANGFGANGYVNSITGLADMPVAYPRILGDRQVAIDSFLRTRMPELMP